VTAVGENAPGRFGEWRSAAERNGQGLGQVSVADRCSDGASAELLGDVEDRPPAWLRLEGAGAVPEAAVGGVQFGGVAEVPVVGGDAGEGVGYLLSVGAGVLDRRGADVVPGVPPRYSMPTGPRRR
jgi:hypothetical protein